MKISWGHKSRKLKFQEAYNIDPKAQVSEMKAAPFYYCELQNKPDFPKSIRSATVNADFRCFTENAFSPW